MLRRASNDLSELLKRPPQRICSTLMDVSEEISYVTRFFPALEFLKEIAAKLSDGEPLRKRQKMAPKIVDSDVAC
jgi:hypothetical protein